MESFYRQDNLTDVIVELNENQQVKLHKVVLCGVSDILKAAINFHDDRNYIKCYTFEAHAMKTFFKFIYDHLDYNEAEELLLFRQISHFYEVASLQDLCLNTLRLICEEQPNRLLFPFLSLL